MSSKNFSDWADVRQLVMEKLANRIQKQLKIREEILSLWFPIGGGGAYGAYRKRWEAAITDEEKEAVRMEYAQVRLAEIRSELNTLAKKLVQATDEDLDFDVAASALTEFCKY